MIETTHKIYLASQSPRRRELLKKIVNDFKSFSVDLDEEFLDGEHPAKTVKRLAKEKMDEALKFHKDGFIITADTIVVKKHQILGKPKSNKDAFNMLESLSANKHKVFTGFAIYSPINKIIITNHCKTVVEFREISKEEIDQYIETGGPLDKAGAYGIQDNYGSNFVNKINGCYFNVVGLPVSKLYCTFRELLIDQKNSK